MKLVILILRRNTAGTPRSANNLGKLERDAFAGALLNFVRLECRARTPSELPLTHSIFIATSLKPFSSNRWTILPTKPRCTPSGLTMMNVRSLFSAIINLQIICRRVKTEHRTMRCHEPRGSGGKRRKRGRWESSSCDEARTGCLNSLRHLEIVYLSESKI